jgi:hypothetical protein
VWFLGYNEFDFGEELRKRSNINYGTKKNPTETAYARELVHGLAGERKQKFDEKKFEEAKIQKQYEETQKYNLGTATLASGERKQLRDIQATQKAQEEARIHAAVARQDALILEREKLDMSKADRTKVLGLERKKMAMAGFLDIQRIQDANKLNKAKLDLEKQKLQYEAGKNDRALWESRLKSGQNMLGSLIGGANNAAQIKQSTAIVSTNLMNNPRLLTGATTGNPYERMNLISLGPSTSYQSKVMSVVGSPSEPKTFAQKVNESMSRKSSEEQLIDQIKNKQNSEQLMFSQTSMAQTVPTQTYMPQNVTQPRFVEPLPTQTYMPQRIPQPVYAQQPPASQIPWEAMPPQQIAQYDPQYAKYVSQSASTSTYRRGPYRKRY